MVRPDSILTAALCLAACLGGAARADESAERARGAAAVKVEGETATAEAMGKPVFTLRKTAAGWRVVEWGF